MKYKIITYQRVKNLGNYESERLEMSVELDEDEDHLVAARQLRLTINALLEEFIPQPKATEEKEVF